jgi:hypothetical protein
MQRFYLIMPIQVGWNFRKGQAKKMQLMTRALWSLMSAANKGCSKAYAAWVMDRKRASPNLSDVLEGESRHLRPWQINPASSKRDYGIVHLF